MRESAMLPARSISFLFLLISTGSCGFIPALLCASSINSSGPSTRTPVIIDTDIGDDTDDCWALVYALKDPQLDVKLITTTCGKQRYRGAIIAKFLQAAGRSDIPIGLGAGADMNKQKRMQNWLGDFDLSNYHGKVLDDGVRALIDTVNNAKSPVKIIAIGPLNTIGAALKKDPTIASRAHLVAMIGSIRIGYGNTSGQAVEYNAWRDIDNAKHVLAAPWRTISIAPLDTGCTAGLVGARYLRLVSDGDPLVQLLLLNSALAHNAKDPAMINFAGSGFDSVAVYLAEGNPARFANMEALRLSVDDHGKTNIDPAGKEMNVATTWKSRDGYLDHLVNVLLSPTMPAARE